MSKDESAEISISMTNTKKEMLAAYEELQEQLERERVAQLKPADRVEEKKKEEAVAAADSLATQGIAKEIGGLKSEIGGMLVELSDKLDEELTKYRQVKQAVEAKNVELEEIYEIERSASSLAALIEAQRQKQAAFEEEMETEKAEFEEEMETKHDAWAREQEMHEALVKERNAADKKQREREQEEYAYRLQREQQVAQESYEYEKAKLEREIQFKREEMEKDLAKREKAVSESEAELNDLRAQGNAFPKQLEAAVNEAVQGTTERLTREASMKEELFKKEFTGEQNVLKSRIEALQQTTKEQAEQIANLSAQLQRSYGQVQDIAVKAIEGSAGMKTYGQPSPGMTEAARRQAQPEE